MKRAAQGMAMMAIFVFLTSCASMPKEKKDPNIKDEWKEKAETSEGYSPTTKKNAYQFTRDTERYKVEGPWELSDKIISLSMNDADVSTVLRALARLVDVDILISEKVSGKINVSVTDVPWNEVFDSILKTQGLSYVNEKNMIRVMTDEDLMAELNRQRLKQSLSKMEPLETRIIKVDFADVKNLKECILNVLGESHDTMVPSKTTPGDNSQDENAGSKMISEDPHTNSLVIRATKTQMATILPIIERLDRPTRQILIQANIVEANHSTARELGAQWGSEGGDFTAGMSLSVTDGAFIGYSTTSGKSTLSIQLSALQSKGKLKILSSPSITTTDNKKAMIESGKEIPYQTVEDGDVNVEYKKAVIHLEVTPHVIDGDMLKLEISTSKDEIDNSIIVNGNPAIITKKAETEVVLFNGSTTVIGGLNKDKDENNKVGIPWLMNLPIIGHLFKWVGDNKEQEEMLIFITPKILGERPQDSLAATVENGSLPEEGDGGEREGAE